ncbi:MAG: hypothetical protein ACD_61C00044G0007, partial [uncultured bacterium]
MFFKKIRSFLLALWAGFLRLVLPKSTPTPIEPKEVTVNDFRTVEGLKALLLDRPSQLRIHDWVQKNLRPLENDAVYEGLCQKDEFIPTAETMALIFTA